MPLLPAAAGLVLTLAGPASAGPVDPSNCTSESVVLVERACAEPGGPAAVACGTGLDLLWVSCQAAHRVAGQPFPPLMERPGGPVVRNLRDLRNRYQPDAPPERDVIATGSGVRRPSDPPDTPVPATNDDGSIPGQVRGVAFSGNLFGLANPGPNVIPTAGMHGGMRTAQRVAQAMAQGRERLTGGEVPLISQVQRHEAQFMREWASNIGQQGLLATPNGVTGGAVVGAAGVIEQALQLENRLRQAPASAQAPAPLPQAPSPDTRRGRASGPTRQDPVDVLLARGALYTLGGDASRAQQAASEALRLTGGASVPALRIRATARLQAGDAEGAAQDARKLAELAPGDADAKRIVGQARELAAGAGRVGKMRIGFGDKGELDIAGMSDRPGSADGAVRADGAAPSAQAQAAAAAAIVLPPVSAAVRGAPAPVRRWLEGLAPRDFEAQPMDLQRLWGSALENAALGRWKPALLDATLLTQTQPQEAGPWLLRAKVLGKLGTWKAAEGDARKVLETRPEDPAALLELGYALLQQGRAEEGLAAIDRALARSNTGLGQLYRAEALEKLGRVPEAVAAYRLAQSLDPVLAPLVEPALARLAPQPFAAAAGGSKGSAPWRRTLLAVSALLAGLLGLAGAAKAGWLGGRSQRAEDGPAPARAREPVTARPGEVLGGHFRVERELARGGMGVVYLATDTVLQRPVAVKRLNREAVASEDARRKFMQEAQLAARLKHPNLAQIHSVFGEGELHLVFEYVEGRGLDAVLGEKGRLGLRETRDVLRQVCAALAHAHDARVIHRDLKPANVMIEPGGGCKILDFGIAHESRTVSNATLTQAWGTPPYMAPEQEEGLVSASSDLYAVGVMAYELLCGSRPFEGANQLGLKRSGSFKALGGRFGLPAEVDRFFARALHPDPAQRFARAADLYAAFDELAGTPVRS